MGNTLTIPIEFFKAVGEKPAVIRVIWIKWLSDYSEDLLKPNFVEDFHLTMKDKKLNLETIKEAYELIRFFEDGLYLKTKKVKKDISKEVSELCEKVIVYLNEKSGSTYSFNKSNTEIIAARVKDGFTISEFKKVIDRKCEQWLGTEQEKYLRPITLFQPKKFENYLNEPEHIKNGKQQQRPASNIEKLTGAANKAKELLG